MQSNKTYPPTLIIHGKQDSVVPIQAAVKAKDELRKIGVAVQYQEFEMAHEVRDEAIALFKQFILDEVIK
jgi:phospholipase/carboxylesterase